MTRLPSPASIVLIALLAPLPAPAMGATEPSQYLALLPITASSRATPDAHIEIDATAHALVQEVAQRSMAFRRQWECLRGTRRLSLRITRLPPDRWGGPEGWTTVTATASGVEAHVHLAAPVGRVVEVLAHELEHVIEQVEGVRLAARRAGGDDSVAVGAHGVETRRAIASGRRVAAEYARTPAETRR